MYFSAQLYKYCFNKLNSGRGGREKALLHHPQEKQLPVAAGAATACRRFSCVHVEKFQQEIRQQRAEVSPHMTEGLHVAGIVADSGTFLSDGL